MDQQLVRRLFHYDNETGDLVWNTRPPSDFIRQCTCDSWNTKFAGKSAVTIDGKGYRVVSIWTKRYLVHRLIWLYVNGYFPKMIDHINGNRLDNRISNLREVDNQQNNMNRRMASNNTSGVVGVYLNKKSNIWCAQMKYKGHTYHLGSSKDFDVAVKMRKAEEERLGFSKRHGEKC